MAKCERTRNGINNEMCARVQGRCVFPKVWCKMHRQTYNKEGTGKQTPNTSITKGQVPTRSEREAHQETAEEDALCGAGTDTETPDRREPVPTGPERDAHQETAESVWSGGRQDVLRMHGIGSVHSVQKKQRGESGNQDQSWLTQKRQIRAKEDGEGDAYALDCIQLNQDTTSTRQPHKDRTKKKPEKGGYAAKPEDRPNQITGRNGPDRRR